MHAFHACEAYIHENYTPYFVVSMPMKNVTMAAVFIPSILADRPGQIGYSEIRLELQNLVPDQYPHSSTGRCINR